MSYLIDPDNWQWLTHANNFRFMFNHFLNNIIIALIAMGFSLIFGLVLALLRLSKRKLVSKVTGIWIDVWRNLPLIFILLYMFLNLPDAWKRAYVDFIPGFMPDVFDTPFFLAAILGLTVYNSAVIAEIMRAGIQSLERGQGEAALALGMPYAKAMRLIILPQGLRRMVPATVSQLITLTKDTSLTSIITIQEGVNGAQIINNTAGNAFVDPGGPQAPILHVFVFLGAMFVVFNFALSRLSRRLEIKERKRTGTTTETVTGLEDQVALDADVVKT
jgi:His/Glu/Gln/Arg/opine family amino acid ABC transporter permease subunit